MQCLKSGVDNPGGSINTARPVPPPCSGAFFSGVFFFFPRCADGYVYDSCSRTHFVNIKKKLAKMRALPVRFRIVGRTVACVGISLFILRLRNTVQLASEDRAGCVRWLCATSLLATGGFQCTPLALDGGVPRAMSCSQMRVGVGECSSLCMRKSCTAC